MSRGLKEVIPLTRTVNYWAANGTTRPMTLARAMAAEKGRGEEVSIFNNTPPDANFLSNPPELKRLTVAEQLLIAHKQSLRAELAAPPLHLLFGNDLTSDLPPKAPPTSPGQRQNRIPTHAGVGDEGSRMEEDN